MVRYGFYSLSIAVQLIEPVFDSPFIKYKLQEYASAILYELGPEEQGGSRRFGNGHGRQDEGSGVEVNALHPAFKLR